MPGYIYILDKNGHPLMPTKRRRRIQKLLNKGLARIAEHVPYTVQLKYDSPCITQPLTEGIDAGRTNIGVSVINDAMDELISVLCITRNKEIKSLMSERKMHRMTGRSSSRRPSGRITLTARRLPKIISQGLSRKARPCQTCRSRLRRLQGSSSKRVNVGITTRTG